MTDATRHAKMVADMIKRRGSDVTLPDGSTVRAIVEKLEATRVPRSYPSGNRNGANAATHVMHIAAASLTSVPDEEYQLQWSGTSYTIVDNTDHDDEDNVPVVYHFKVYRTPVKPASADDSDQEALFEYVEPTG